MFLKAAFLLAYFLLVFIGARLFDFYVTSVAGWKCFNDIFPTFFDDLLEQSYDERDENSNRNFSEENVEPEIDGQSSRDYSSGETGFDASKRFHLDFTSYGEFEENVEDTKACIWVVLVKNSKRNSMLNKHEWMWISRRLQQYGINVGTYQCFTDPRLCVQRKIYSSAIVLALPKGSHPKGNMDFHMLLEEAMDKIIDRRKFVYNWIKSKLYPKVKTVHSLSELLERPMPRYKHMISKPSMFFIYQSDKRVPPLLLTTLSVKFTGRIKFYMFRTKDTSKLVNVFAMSPNIMYDYGKNRGEYFNYSCVEFFLRTLHPEVNDIFVISVILLNMACWLELFLQKGGPLKRLLYYFWGFAVANVILVSIWLLLIQLLYMPEAQPIIELCLMKFQQVMFTNIAAIIRKDIIQLSKHLYIVLFGFVGYGIIVGYLRYRMRRSADMNSQSSILDIIHYDVQEISELFHSVLSFITPSLRIYIFEESIERILNRLAVPDLWLHSKYVTDYIHELPTWTYYCNDLDCFCENSEDISDEEISSECEDPSTLNDNPHNEEIKLDSGMYFPSQLLSDDCVICLEMYNCGDRMRGLPCGHCFHKGCIDSWLFPSHGISHRQCPVCRWPADIKKGKAEVIDFT